jgi:hypothetical protein
MIKICGNCDKEYETSNSKSKYCNLKCYHQACIIVKKDPELKQYTMVMFKCMGFNKEKMPKFQWWPCREIDEIFDHKRSKDLASAKHEHTKTYMVYRTLLDVPELDDKTINKMKKCVVEMTIMHSEPMWIEPATFANKFLFPSFTNKCKI